MRPLNYLCVVCVQLSHTGSMRIHKLSHQRCRVSESGMRRKVKYLCLTQLFGPPRVPLCWNSILFLEKTHTKILLVFFLFNNTSYRKTRKIKGSPLDWWSCVCKLLAPAVSTLSLWGSSRERGKRRSGDENSGPHLVHRDVGAWVHGGRKRRARSLPAPWALYGHPSELGAGRGPPIGSIQVWS